jgi:hypothetical protein
MRYAGLVADLRDFEPRVAFALRRRGDDIIGLGDPGVRRALEIPQTDRAADFLSRTGSGQSKGDFNITEAKGSTGSSGADVVDALHQIESTFNALESLFPNAKINRLEIAVPRGATLRDNYKNLGNRLVNVTDEGTEYTTIRGIGVWILEID